MFNLNINKLRQLSVTNRMYVGFGTVIFTLIVVAVLTLLRLNAVNQTTDDVLKQYQPAMVATLQLSSKVKDTLRTLAFYLLSKEDKDLQLYEANNEETFSLIEQLVNTPIIKTTPNLHPVLKS